MKSDMVPTNLSLCTKRSVLRSVEYRGARGDIRLIASICREWAARLQGEAARHRPADIELVRDAEILIKYAQRLDGAA